MVIHKTNSELVTVRILLTKLRYFYIGNITMGIYFVNTHSKISANILIDVSRDQSGGMSLGQRIRFTIQRGNATILLGSFPIDVDIM